LAGGPLANAASIMGRVSARCACADPRVPSGVGHADPRVPSGVGHADPRVPSGVGHADPRIPSGVGQSKSALRRVMLAVRASMERPCKTWRATSHAERGRDIMRSVFGENLLRRLLLAVLVAGLALSACLAA